MLVHKPGRPGEHIDESRPLAPGWAYPKSKAAAEQAIREERGDIPVPMGILRQVKRPILENDIHAQVAEATAKQGKGSLEGLLSAGDTWTVS